MKIHLSAPLLAVSLFAACSTSPTEPVDQQQFSGKWHVTFFNTGATHNPSGTFEFKQEADSLTGRFAQPGKNPVSIERGFVKGDSLFFRMRTNLTADAPRYLYILKGWRQKGSQDIEGTWWYTRGEGTWTASRF